MHFFPTPYKDELLYSVLARYCMRSGNIREIHNFEDLFGTRNCVAVMELATHLDALIRNMPANTKYTADYFIFNHTLFPYLAAFIPPDRAERIISYMRNGDGSASYISLGLVSSSMQRNPYFRFCPECFEEDIRIYGEPYWHRLHQVAGVFVCPKHKVPLYNSTVLVRGGNRQQYINPDIENCVVRERISYNSNLMEKMIWMAEDVRILLDNKFPHREPQWFKDQFRVKLVEKGYARMNNFIHQKKLKEDFIDFYGREYLELLQSPVTKNSGWLDAMVRGNNKVTNPIRYLLLARFLGINLYDLFNCKLKLPGENDDGASSSIEVYQQLWDQRLIELCQTGLSIRQIASILGSSTKTVRKHIDRLGIEPFWKYNGGGQFKNKKYLETDEFKKRMEAMREKWLQLHAENPDKSSNMIRKDDETLYTWLSRYDREWLSQNLRRTTRIANRVDWNKRDKELLPKVKEVVEGMRQGKPQRITWYTVGSKLGISGWFSKNRNKLPLVKEYMESVVETLEEFQVRKVKWAIDELEREGKALTMWNIAEKAGVKPNYMKAILKEIQKMLADKECDIDFLC